MGEGSNITRADGTVNTAGTVTCHACGPFHLLSMLFWAATAMWLHVALNAQNCSDGKWGWLLTECIVVSAVLKYIAPSGYYYIPSGRTWVKYCKETAETNCTHPQIGANQEVCVPWSQGFKDRPWPHRDGIPKWRYLIINNIRSKGQLFTYTGKGEGFY